ncbi:MAG: hypothetical protein WA009_05545 [Phototrophicaceae bacterium]
MSDYSDDDDDLLEDDEDFFDDDEDFDDLDEDDGDFYVPGVDPEEDRIADLDGSKTIIFWDEDTPIFDDDQDDDI